MTALPCVASRVAIELSSFSSLAPRESGLVAERCLRLLRMDEMFSIADSAASYTLWSGSSQVKRRSACGSVARPASG